MAEESFAKNHQQQNSDAKDSTKNSSEASVLIEVSQTIERHKIRLQNLKNDSVRIEPNFQHYSRTLYRLNELLDSLREGQQPTSELKPVEYEWNHVRDILDFLLARRRSIHLQINILSDKLKKEKELMDLLIEGETLSALRRTDHKITPSAEAVKADTTGSAAEPEEDLEATNLEQYNWRIIERERELETLRGKFEYSKKIWLLIEQLIELNHADLTVAQGLLTASNSQRDKWNKKILSLTNDLNMLKLDTLTQLHTVVVRSIRETTRLRARIVNTISGDSALVSNIGAMIVRLNGVQKPLSQTLADVTDEIQKKSRWLEFIKGPFGPYRAYAFLVKTVPRILILLVLLFLVWAGSRWAIVRIISSLKLAQYKSAEERRERMETLKRVIQSAITVLVLVIGTMALLTQLGIDVSVLLGGAAVFSLAIAFGAQSLIKDYFSGFMILTENQYSVGNFVRINQVSGWVEDISLRMTTLRDMQGVAHFIPHGQISFISNLTFSWSQVMLDIKVAYKEKVDEVIQIIKDVIQELQNDPEFGNYIWGQPEVLGVEDIEDYCVLIRSLIKTMPVKQWAVKRELLRRIKNRFDENGIDIPFPQRIIYGRIVEGMNAEKFAKEEGLKDYLKSPTVL